MKRTRGKTSLKTPYSKKSLGQNFLADQNYIDKIISALNPQKDETIIEIGPGRGALTNEIVKRAEKVIGIEIDGSLVELLNQQFAQTENFVLMEKDALEIDFGALVSLQSPSGKTKLVANLPYYISTAILQHLIPYRRSFSEMILMLQKEVVERITAPPGTRARGFLTVLIERYFDTTKLFDVPPSAFRPVPKVTSSVMRLITYSSSKPDMNPGDVNPNSNDEAVFYELASAAFMHKRKTLWNNLKNTDAFLSGLFESKGGVRQVLEDASIDPNVRAEALARQDWEKLFEVLSAESG